MDENLKKHAKDLLESGKLEELHNFIQPYLFKNEPYAIYLSSCFSLHGSSETSEEFSRRSVQLRTLASSMGVAEASYNMGVNHLYGDDVEQDFIKSNMYFERAINQGHSYTKFTFGFSLYYGNNAVERNVARGLSLLEEAAREGIEEAISELRVIQENNV